VRKHKRQYEKRIRKTNFLFGACITKKPPVVAACEVRIGKMMEWYDCSNAVNELGLPQTPIHMNIKKALNWFSENGYLTKIAN
jgi:dihydroflavonol-4-reductase